MKTLLKLTVLSLGAMLPPCMAASFDFDQSGQLFRADYGSGNGIQYNYDVVGNRTVTVSAFNAAYPPLALSPTVTPNSTAASLGAVLALNGASATAWIEWGPSSQFGNSTPRRSLSSAAATVEFTETLAGLSPGTVYYYRVVASNSAGTSNGDTLSFKTLLSDTADIGLIRGPGTSPAVVGEQTYRLTITNHGPNAAPSVRLVENIRGVGKVVSAKATQGNCVLSGQGAACDLGSIPNGGSIEVTLVLRSSMPGWIYKEATVTTDATDPNLANNSAIAELQIIPATSTEPPPDTNVSAKPALACGWEWVNPQPTGADLYSVAYGNSTTVTVGDGGMILSRRTGEPWRQQFSGANARFRKVVFVGNRFIALGVDSSSSSADGVKWVTFPNINSVAWNGQLYVAVNSYGGILSSSDGESWWEQVSGSSYSLTDILWKDGQFIAVGGTGSILTSVNGKDWKQEESGTSNNLGRIISQNGLFLVLGPHDILTSPDGRHWTKRYSDTSQLNQLSDIAFNGSVFVVTGLFDGKGNDILTSSNGIEWSPHKTGLNNGFSILTRGSLFLGVGGGQDFTSNWGFIATSLDGVAWTVRRANDLPALSSVTWADDHFTAVGREGVILTSANRIDWSGESQAITRDKLNDVVVTDTHFIAVGNGGTVVAGIDGTNWKLRPTPTLTNLYSVAWNGKTLVAVGSRGTILTAANAAGIDWIARDSVLTNTLRRVIWAGKQFLIAGSEVVVDISGNELSGVPGSSVILSSPDGTTWTRQIVPAGLLNDSLKDVAWNGTSFVVSGHYTMLTSADGVRWTDVSSGLTSFNLAITTFGSMFVGVSGGDGSVVTSPDGLTWTKRRSATQANLLKVTANQNLVAAVGLAGTIVTSTDGINWQLENSGAFIIPGGNLYGIAVGAGRLVAVGSKGAILRNASDCCDLVVTQEATPSPVEADTDLAYTISVRNQGPMYATGVTLKDTPPGGVTLLAVVSSQGDSAVDLVTGEVQCRLGDLAVGQVATVTLHVVPVRQKLFKADVSSVVIQNTVEANGTESFRGAVRNSAALLTKVFIKVPGGDDSVNPPSTSPPSTISNSEFIWVNPLPQGEDLGAIATGNGVSVALGRNGVVLTAGNGIDWSVGHTDLPITAVPDYSFSGIRGKLIWGKNEFVLTSPDGLYASSDGVHWVLRNSSQSLNYIAWNGKTYVASYVRTLFTNEAGPQTKRDVG